MKTFVIANQKGGVGKTAIACHLAFYLAEKGRGVLFIDTDPQGNSSKTLKHGSQPIQASQFFSGNVSLKEINEGITLVPADGAMADIERADPQVIANFRQNIDVSKDLFDFCVIDTPPTLGMRVTAALIAADYVISPIKPEGYSIDGIAALLKVIIGVKQKYNPQLQFLGMLPCLVKGNSPDHKTALQSLVNEYHQFMLSGAVIGDRQSVDEALNSCVPVWRIRKTAAVAAAKEFRNTFDIIGNKIGGF
jgi:chromosome partitioning protein